MMKKKALIKDIFVEIRKTRNRYISLFLITALGVAFFAGIRATGPDMRQTADQYYHEKNLMDIRVLSTLGLTDEDVQAILKVEGIEEVMPAYSCDALLNLEDQQVVLKMMSTPDSINQITVEQGRLPEQSNECLVDRKFLDNTDYEIGDTIEVFASGEKSITDTLDVTEFTIVGSGLSPYYLSMERGSSSIGNGSVFAFVIIPGEAFSLDAYTEVYLTLEGADAYTSYTDQYDDFAEAAADRVEAISEERSQIRYAEIIEEGNQKIADAEADIANGEDELADAEQKLTDAGIEIEDAKKEIEDGRKELDDSWVTFYENEEKLNDAQTQIDDGYAQLATAKSEFNEGNKQLKAARTELNDKWSEYQAGLNEWESKQAEFAGVESEYQAGLASLEENKQLLENLQALELMGDTSYSEQIVQLDAAITETEAVLEASRIQIEAAKAEFSSTKLQLDEAASQLNAAEQEILQQEAQAANAQATIQDTEDTLNRSQAEVDQNRTELEEARQILIDAETELEEARQTLADGEAELTEKEAEYEEAKAENEPKIADAKEEIEEAKADLAELEVPEWYVLDRQYLQTYVEYGQNADRIQAIGVVFPLIFFIVAALVCLTTMTRMVDEQRTQIGCLKALGYSKVDISAKYIIYALSASLFGSLFGLVIGQKLLPYFIITAYKILYTELPGILLPLNAEYSFTSTAAAVICTTAATMLACFKTMASVPAALMRPSSPKSGKRVFLERITFIWNHLNFSNKATFRNLVRYKKRFFMTLFGIGGCMALIVVGFGLYDSISSIGDLQFSYVHIYDSQVSLADDESITNRDAALEFIEVQSQVDSAMLLSSNAVDVSAGNMERSAYLMVPHDLSELDKYINLQGRVSGETYTLTDNQVIISEKLAKLLDVSIGDIITLKEDDTGTVEVTIQAITENYFYHYVYMTPTTYETLYGVVPEYNSILLNTSFSDSATEDAFNEKVLKLLGVSGITLTSDTADSARDMLKSMNSVIYILIISAGLLAFVVLYNLNNINVSERIRELATLKVLGFYDYEVSAYVIKENVWLTIIGIVIGTFLGKALHLYVIQTAEVDLTMFGRNITTLSFVFSAGLTFLFSAVVNFVMHRKLKKVNMVESIKSVE